MTITQTTWIQRLRSLRTWADYQLRDRIRFHLPVRDLGAQQKHYAELQSELADFLSLGLDETSLSLHPDKKLIVLDIGAKDFFAGPVLEVFVRSLSAQPCEIEIHGIEIDAYRRMQNLRSRSDYAQYFCSQMQNGHFHAMGFQLWHQKADMLFWLNPFVSPEPLLRWGLPLGQYQPAALFQHAYDVLKKGGWLWGSSPTEKEQDQVHSLAYTVGFEFQKKWEWHPTIKTVQKQPRFGWSYKKVE